MFVTEVGALITTVLLVTGHGAHFGFQLQIALWLWFTVLFANFAEAMAEGRGKAQAKALRATRTETFANRLKSDGTVEKIAANLLRKGDVVVVAAGELIPGDFDRCDSRPLCRCQRYISGINLGSWAAVVSASGEW